MGAWVGTRAGAVGLCGATPGRAASRGGAVHMQPGRAGPGCISWRAPSTHSATLCPSSAALRSGQGRAGALRGVRCTACIRAMRAPRWRTRGGGGVHVPTPGIRLESYETSRKRASARDTGPKGRSRDVVTPRGVSQLGWCEPTHMPEVLTLNVPFTARDAARRRWNGLRNSTGIRCRVFCG